MSAGENVERRRDVAELVESTTSRPEGPRAFHSESVASYHPRVYSRLDASDNRTKGLLTARPRGATRLAKVSR